MADLAWHSGDVVVFAPGQPRWPAGHPQGGQWKSSGGEGATSLDPLPDRYSAVRDQYNVVNQEKYDNWINSDAMVNWEDDANRIDAISSISEYSNSSKTFNEWADGSYVSADKDYTFEERSAIADESTRLEAAIASAPPVPEDIRLYRGSAGAAFADTEVGDTFVDPHFTSASSQGRTAERFSQQVDGPYGVVTVIDVPAGATNLLPIDNWSRHTGENEVILNMGAIFRVKEVRPPQYDGAPQVVHVDLVGFEG